jgi:hypothetical protein
MLSSRNRLLEFPETPWNSLHVSCCSLLLLLLLLLRRL